jgi:protein subunit release factor A
MGTVDDAGTGLEGSPENPAVEIKRLQREVVIEVYRAPGPGGQRKNRKETAVRLKHIPTGITVVASERRSQALNREIAFERLQKRLAELYRPRKRRVRTKPPAGAVGAQRGEKKRQSQRKRSRSRIDVPAELD